MTLTELRYIVAVADHLHFGKASDACCVSQPTLSLGVKRLEDELGVQIFSRSKSVEVTEQGEAIVAQSRVVLDAANVLKTMKPTGARLRLVA